MSEGRVFTGTMSYHRMLTRAQETDPVLTYWICRYLLEEEERESERVKKEDYVEPKEFKHSDFVWCMGVGQVLKLTERAFFNLTVECYNTRRLRARREFVVWLKTLKLSFDHDHHFVTIPA